MLEIERKIREAEEWKSVFLAEKSTEKERDRRQVIIEEYKVGMN